MNGEPLNPDILDKILQTVAEFYDQRKVGHVGSLGFRRSSDLARVKACVDGLMARSLLVPQETLFLDMGCADGRVNVLMSYVTKKSIGIEVNEWILDEYGTVKAELDETLKTGQLLLPPDNISLFLGDTLDDEIHRSIKNETGVDFEDFDLFYTYLTIGKFDDGCVVLFVYKHKAEISCHWNGFQSLQSIIYRGTPIE